MSVIEVIIALLFCVGNGYDYDVIIMGGGMAGLSAFKRLKELGVNNILILEAKDYIGGRMKTVEFGGYNVSVGASWLQDHCYSNCDGYANPLFSYINKLNLQYYPMNADITILTKNGTILDSNEAQKLYDEYETTLECIGNKLDTNNFYYKTNGNWMLNLRFGYQICGWDKAQTPLRKTMEYVYFEERAEDFSLYNSGLDQLITDSAVYGDLFINDTRGYAGVVIQVAKEAGIDVDNIASSNIIRLNNAVKSIDYEYDKKKGIKISVENLLNNEEYTLTAEYGILTFSLGVMQSGMIEFKPELPNWKLGSLMSMKMDYYLPVYIKWPYNFWNKYGITSNVIYFSDDIFGYWIVAYNFDLFFNDNNTLLWRFDISGDIAYRISFQSKQFIINEILNKLSPYFNETIPEPIDIYFNDWITDKYFQGSYSNEWPPGFRIKDKKKMGYRLNNLFFAGEAYGDDDNGFAHTAYLSGTQKAEQIGKCLGKYKKGTCPRKNKYKDGSWSGILGFPDYLWGIFIPMLVIICCFITCYCRFKCKQRKNKNNEMGTQLNQNEINNENIEMNTQ